MMDLETSSDVEQFEYAILHLTAHRENLLLPAFVPWNMAAPADRLTSVGRYWLDRAARHLAQRLATALRDGQPTARTPARLVLQTAIDDLRHAAVALEHAAEAMRAKGMPSDARRAYEATLAARSAIVRLNQEAVRLDAEPITAELHHAGLSASEPGRQV